MEDYNDNLISVILVCIIFILFIISNDFLWIKETALVWDYKKDSLEYRFVENIESPVPYGEITRFYLIKGEEK